MSLEKILLDYSGVVGAKIAAKRADLAYVAAAAAAAAYAADDASLGGFYSSFEAYYYAVVNVLSDAQDYANKTKKNASFFKPLRSTSDAFFSAASIVSAPVFLFFLAAKEALDFIVFALKSIVNLVMLDIVIANDFFKKSSNSLLETVESLLAAAISPLVNSVDFVGSVVTSLMSKSSKEEAFDLSFTPTF